MALPTYQGCKLPLLRHCRDGGTYNIAQLAGPIAQELKISADDLARLVPNGQRTYFYDRLSWAKTYMVKACLLEQPARAVFKITQRGLDLLATSPESIDDKLLLQYPEFTQWINKSNKTIQTSPDQTQEDIIDEPVHPEEQLEAIYDQMRGSLAQELLELILNKPPFFFEQLVVDLLVAMGYGGSRKDAGQALGRTGDGGIDGIIKEDRLGLDVIYLQAKRYAIGNTVPSREVRDFTGSLEGHGAQKGVLITTSNFSKDGIDFVKRLQQKKIVLIDGEKLSQLMIDYNIGVSEARSYVIKKIDYDYFEID